VYGPLVRCVLLHGFAGDPASWDDIAIDADRIALPGHLGGGPVAADWAANLAALAARVGPCDAVVGYSLGARVALGLVIAGHAPRAVLISANPGIADADRAARRTGDAAWAQLARSRGIEPFLSAWQAQPLFATEQLAQSLEAMGLAEMPDYRALVDHRFALIAGADDPKFVALNRALPAPLELIADSGHDPLLEQPVALTQAIDRALHL